MRRESGRLIGDGLAAMPSEDDGRSARSTRTTCRKKSSRSLHAAPEARREKRIAEPPKRADDSAAIGRGGQLNHCNAWAPHSGGETARACWRGDCEKFAQRGQQRPLIRRRGRWHHWPVMFAVGRSSAASKRQMPSTQRGQGARLGSTPVALHTKPATNIRMLPTAAHLLQTPVKMPVPHLQRKSVWSPPLTRFGRVRCTARPRQVRI